MTELDCKDIRAMLSGLIDGELDVPTRHQAERHLVDCKVCRDLVNEAEGLNNLLALEAQRQLLPAFLPKSFENAVLRQTVYGEAMEYAGRRWTSWLGWVAAAACLGLACSFWFVNRQMVPASDKIAMAPERLDNAPIRSTVYAIGGKSWTYDGGLPLTAPGADSGHAPSAMNEESSLAVDDQFTQVLPVSYTNEPAILDTTPQDSISREDAETLYTASNLLDMFVRADRRSFANVERIRRIAEYDGLLERLAESRTRLSAADRAIVMAAEAVLLRIVNGPLSLDDLHTLHDAATSLDLSTQVEAISNRWQPASSL